MIVTTVHVKVKKDFVNKFIEASLENHAQSIKEPGNLRFDILQSMEDETEFTLYEAYDSIESSKLHKETAHYKKWKAEVENWMQIPRTGKPHKILAPLKRELWK